MRRESNQVSHRTFALFFFLNSLALSKTKATMGAAGEIQGRAVQAKKNREAGKKKAPTEAAKYNLVSGAAFP